MAKDNTLLIIGIIILAAILFKYSGLFTAYPIQRVETTTTMLADTNEYYLFSIAYSAENTLSRDIFTGKKEFGYSWTMEEAGPPAIILASVNEGVWYDADESNVRMDMKTFAQTANEQSYPISQTDLASNASCTFRERYGKIYFECRVGGTVTCPSNSGDCSLTGLGGSTIKIKAWKKGYQPACIPSCTNVINVCSNESYSDGCGSTCQGTKNCAVCSSHPNSPCTGAIWKDYPTCSWNNSDCGVYINQPIYQNNTNISISLGADNSSNLSYISPTKKESVPIVGVQDVVVLSFWDKYKGIIILAILVGVVGFIFLRRK